MSPKKHIHFIAIGGSGMSGIAEVLLNQGHQISGSDIVANTATMRLKQLGATINIGHRPRQINGADIVVTSTAIKDNNSELQAAQKAHIPIMSRAEMLAQLMRLQKGIAIAGTHGKTTTTSLVSSILTEAGLDPTFVIGGLLQSAGANAKLGKSEYFVAEADESDASFLILQPNIAIVTNIDEDHMTTYDNDFSKLKQTFVQFLQQLPFDGLAVLCIDDPAMAELHEQISRPQVSYGFANNADYHLQNYHQYGVTSEFEIKTSESVLSITLNLPGRHNALNATAAVAVAKYLGIKDAAIKSALAKFAGVGRRFQLYGEFKTANGNIILIDDYGHHPREVSVTLVAVRDAWPRRRLVMAYQPHRYTRTQALFGDFVNVLQEVDVLVLLDVYPAGEKCIPGADGPALYQAICAPMCAQGKLKPIFVKQIDELPHVLKKVLKNGDVLLTQGAGSIGAVASQLSQLWIEG